MIEVTVHYGNHNKYQIELPSTTKVGLLSWYLTKIVDLSPNDVLYLIMGGYIIGSPALPFSKILADCNIINDRCVVSMVLRDAGIKYPDSDLYTSIRNSNWIQKNGAATSASSNGAVPLNMTTFFQSMGLDPNSLVDIQVSLTETEYEQHITQLSGPVEDPCSICHNAIDEGVSLSCGHPFHDNCIREWLTSRSVRCPSCNYDVRTEQE
jgi:hypothetical protein